MMPKGVEHNYVEDEYFGTVLSGDSYDAERR